VRLRADTSQRRRSPSCQPAVLTDVLAVGLSDRRRAVSAKRR
jgi:hypothetical protein